MQRGQWCQHEDGEGMSPGNKDGDAAYQWGLSIDEVADGAAQRCFFEGGEGGRSIEEEEGRRVGSSEEGGTTGVAALRPNSDEGRGSRCLSTMWTGSWC
jgi:hypothetical protein